MNTRRVFAPLSCCPHQDWILTIHVSIRQLFLLDHMLRFYRATMLQMGRLVPQAHTHVADILIVIGWTHRIKQCVFLFFLDICEINIHVSKWPTSRSRAFFHLMVAQSLPPPYSLSWRATLFNPLYQLLFLPISYFLLLLIVIPSFSFK